MIEETLVASNYIITDKKRSRIDPRAKITVVVGTYCPRCKCAGPPLEHGDEHVCECGLKMQLFGNALVCQLED